MPVRKGKYSGDSTTSIAAAIVIVLILIVGAGAMILGAHDDLYDDTIKTAAEFGKIAVAADGKKLNSYVSPLFGRAKYFLIVDPNTGEYKAIRNPFRNLDGAAGVRAAQMIAKKVDDADSGSIVICVNDGEALIKKIGKEIEGKKKRVILISLNPKYSPFLAKDDFRIEGEVKGVITNKINSL